MPVNTPITFVIPVNNDEIFSISAMTSPVLKNTAHEIVVKRNYSSASLAYNDALSGSSNDLFVFMHQDVYLPEGWDSRLLDIIESMDNTLPWGVLGCAGITHDHEVVGHVYSNGMNSVLGKPDKPREVVSLDEMILILKKSNGIRFDPALPHFHLYGTDICLESNKLGFKNYAIDNFCFHNDETFEDLPGEFWACISYLNSKWKLMDCKPILPIKTLCAIIPSNNIEKVISRLKSELYLFKCRLFKKQIKRIMDVQEILQIVNSTMSKNI